MFRFIKKPSSRSHSQFLAKIARIGSELRLSVVWRHRMTCMAFVFCTVQAILIIRLPHRTYYAAIALTTSVRRLSQL